MRHPKVGKYWFVINAATDYVVLQLSLDELSPTEMQSVVKRLRKSLGQENNVCGINCSDNLLQVETHIYSADYQRLSDCETGITNLIATLRPELIKAIALTCRSKLRPPEKSVRHGKHRDKFAQQKANRLTCLTRCPIMTA